MEVHYSQRKYSSYMAAFKLSYWLWQAIIQHFCSNTEFSVGKCSFLLTFVRETVKSVWNPKTVRCITVLKFCKLRYSWCQVHQSLQKSVSSEIDEPSDRFTSKSQMRSEVSFDCTWECFIIGYFPAKILSAAISFESMAVNSTIHVPDPLKLNPNPTYKSRNS